MNTFKPNDKVVCIDATPIPIGAPNNSYQDFKFPNGYIEEGTVYCVRSVIMGRCSGESLDIVGPYVLLNNNPVPWNGQRFRKLERNKEKMKRKAENAVPVLSWSQSQQRRLANKKTNIQALYLMSSTLICNMLADYEISLFMPNRSSMCVQAKI
jgi:hypothetical protein